jgi:hypothetical protein
MNMELIKNLKGAHKLTGCLTVLSYFISRLDERGLPLYKLLKKGPTTLNRLMQFLTTPFVLVSMMPKEPMLLYIMATT